MTAATTCIYCRRTSDDTVFDREHVIPQSLGKFEPDNVVLYCVCKDCNGSLGRTVDAVLGRDSAEAILRFTHGLKSPSKTHDLGNKRAILRAPAAPAETHGAFLRLSSDSEGILTKTCFQIHVLNRTSQQYEFFREEDFKLLKERSPELELDALELHGSPSATESDWQRIRQQLSSIFSEIDGRKVTFGEINDTAPSINVPTISQTIDVPLQRALTKIAFNYLAYAAIERNIEELIWHPELEPIRQFVKCGTEFSHRIFAVEQEPIDWPIAPGEQAEQVHLLRVDWLFHRNGKKTLRVRVNLFNANTYAFWLIPNFPERPLPRISMAHLFNLHGPPRKCRKFDIPEFVELG